MGMVACELRPGISAKRTAAFGAGLTAPANTRAKVSAATGRDKIDMDGSLVRFGYLACDGPANDFFNVRSVAIGPGATALTALTLRRR